MSDKKYYISTAIAYTSAKPHIGNTRFKGWLMLTPLLRPVL